MDSYSKIHAPAHDLSHGEFFSSSVQNISQYSLCLDFYFFLILHIHLLPYYRAAPHNQPQPQDCPKERTLHLFLLTFRRLLPGCGLMGPQPTFLEQTSASIVNKGLLQSAAKPLGPVFEFREKH